MKKVKKEFAIEEIVISKDWKNKNIMYLKEIQKFFDIADNIADKNLRKQIIGQMLNCDEALTKIIEDTCQDICNKI